MQRFQFTTIDRVLSSFQRNIGDEDVSEDVIIEWAGEALDFLYRKGNLQECVLFAIVEDYKVEMPEGFKYISGILRNTKFNGVEYDNLINANKIFKEVRPKCNVCEEEIPDKPEKDCCCACIEQDRLTCYLGPGGDKTPLLRSDLNNTLYQIPIPYLQLPWAFGEWYSSHMCQSQFSKVYLSDNRFFKSKVLKSPFDIPQSDTCRSEYTLAGNCIKFSFEKGQVAISYLKAPVDPETGYPLIPDDVSFIKAITAYIKWQLADFYSWNGRQGYAQESQNAERLWLRYSAQARVKSIKIRTKDEASMINNNHRGFYDIHRY